MDKIVISIHQNSYIPWYGFFDKIKQSDIFILLDDVQYSKNNWINRNKILTKQGVKWLTIPVKVKLGQLINEVKIVENSSWKRKHINTIEQNYHCKDKWEWRCIKRIIERDYTNLSDLNNRIIKFISEEVFKFDTVIIDSSSLDVKETNPDDRIIKIVDRFIYSKNMNDFEYLAGQGGKKYMDLKKYPFKVRFQEYGEEEPLSVLHRILS